MLSYSNTGKLIMFFRCLLTCRKSESSKRDSVSSVSVGGGAAVSPLAVVSCVGAGVRGNLSYCQGCNEVNMCQGVSLTS